MNKKKILSIILSATIITGNVGTLSVHAVENNTKVDSVQNEEETVNTEEGVVNTEEEAVNTEEEAVNTEEEVVNTEKEVVNTEEEVVNTEKEVVNTEEEVVNTEEETETNNKTRQTTNSISPELIKKVNDLYKDSNYEQLSDSVTQEKIDSVKKEIDALPNSSEKQHYQIIIQRASTLLQEFTFKGIGNWVFAKLFYHADGSNYASLKINAGQPHAYFDLYASIKVKDQSGEIVYTKEFKGNTWYNSTVENIPLKEGYTLEIMKKESGSRFDTNHNDELKQDTKEIYTYAVQNSKLVRLNDLNRKFHFLGLGDNEYANLKLDYNSRKLILTTRARQPHVYFDYTYVKLEIFDNKGNSIYLKDFIGTDRLENKTEEIPFEIGYKIKLTAIENSRVKIYNDKNETDSSLNVKKGETTFLIEKGGLVNEFNIDSSMKQVYIENFETRIGRENLQEFANKDEKHNEFIEWIYNTPEAISLYLGGGYASAIKQGHMDSYQYRNPLNKANEVKALEIWYQIWNQFENSHEGTNLKIALAVSLEFANGVSTWLKNEEIDPLSRYKNFSNATSSNLVLGDFASLTVEEMRNVVNAKVADDEMEWLRDYIITEHPDMVNRNEITKGYKLLKYQEINPDTGESIYGNNFYGPNPTIREVIKYGGVCGSISKFSAILAQAFGVPAFPVGQPGHCAYIYLDANHSYQLGYDVFGWEQNANYNTTWPYMKLHNFFSQNYEKYKASEYKKYQALTAKDDNTAIQYLDEAISIEPLNYSAWEEKIKIYARNYSYEEFENLMDEVRTVFADYPVIMENLTQDKVKNGVKELFKDAAYTQLADGVSQEKIDNLKSSLNSLPEGKYKQEYYSLIDKASELLQQFNLLGLSNRVFAQLFYYADGSNYAALKINAGKPHLYFNNTYVSIKVKDESGQEVYTKELKGNTWYESTIENLPLKEGYTLEFKTEEPSRFSPNHDDLKTNHVNKTYTYTVKNNRITKK